MKLAVAALALLGVFAAPSARAADPPAVQVFGHELVLRLGGLLQGQFEAGDPGDSRWTDGNDRLYLRRARLNATGRFAEGFDFRLEVELTGTLASSTSLRGQLTDAYVTWTPAAAAGVRVGQFKTPFGYEQLYSDPLLATPERSLASDRLTQSRQLGVEILGDLLEKRISYAAGFFNGTGANNNFNDDDRFLWAGRVNGVGWKGRIGGAEAAWTAGANAFTSKDTSVSQASDFGFDATPETAARDGVFAGSRRAWGADTQLAVGPVELSGEYLRTAFEPKDAIPERKFDADGGYVQGTGYLLPGRLQVVGKYERFDTNRGSDGDETSTWTAGVNWYVKGNDLKLQAHWLRFDVPGRGRESRLIARLQAWF